MAKRQAKEISHATVAITGGARGIGAATATAFAGKGATVAIGDLDGQLAQQTAQALPKPGRGFHLDVTDTASFEQFVAASRRAIADTNIDISCVMPGPGDTELTAGIPTGPFIRFIEPHDVADAIVAAVERPRFDVYVPRPLAGLALVGYLLPRRARDGLGRLLKADTAVQRTDWAARRAYEDRAARQPAETS